MSPKTIAVWILVLWINCFELSLSHPDGSATRRESVVVDTEGNAQVDDLIRQFISGLDEGAGKSLTPSVAKNQTFPMPRIGEQGLKSLAG